MEESEIIWEGFVILRKGPYWVIKNSTRYVGGTFTNIFEAKKYIRSRIEKEKIRAYNSGLRKIRKMPIKKRKKEYEKLCQTLNILSPLSQEG